MKAKDSGLRVLFTVKETCAALCISRTTLYGLVRNGSIETVRIGERGIRIPAAEVDRFVTERGQHGN